MTATRRRVSSTQPSNQPAAVRLVRPFGYIAEGGAEYYWRSGQRVTVRQEIDLLVRMGADLEDDPCPDR